MYGVCKVCGCTDNDPCFHPDYGMCWWVDETHELCSHCADPEIAESPEVQHCYNTLCENQFCDTCVHLNLPESICNLEGECTYERRIL